MAIKTYLRQCSKRRTDLCSHSRSYFSLRSFVGEYEQEERFLWLAILLFRGLLIPSLWTHGKAGAVREPWQNITAHLMVAGSRERKRKDQKGLLEESLIHSSRACPTDPPPPHQTHILMFTQLPSVQTPGDQTCSHELWGTLEVVL